MQFSHYIDLKVPKFLNEKYFTVFKEILQDTFIDPDFQKEEKMNFKDEAYNNSKRKSTNSLWRKVGKLLFEENQEYLNEGKIISELEFLYLKKKAINVASLIIFIGIKFNQTPQKVFQIYINKCRNEIFFRKNKARQSLIPKKDHKNPHSPRPFSSEDKPNHLINTDKKAMTLLLGDFSIEKLINKKQTIKFKKGRFCSTIIFCDEDSKRKSLRKSRGSTSMPKLFSLKGKSAFHRFNSFRFPSVEKTTEKREKQQTTQSIFKNSSTIEATSPRTVKISSYSAKNYSHSKNKATFSTIPIKIQINKRFDYPKSSRFKRLKLKPRQNNKKTIDYISKNDLFY